MQKFLLQQHVDQIVISQFQAAQAHLLRPLSKLLASPTGKCYWWKLYTITSRLSAHKIPLLPLSPWHWQHPATTLTGQQKGGFVFFLSTLHLQPSNNIHSSQGPLLTVIPIDKHFSRGAKFHQLSPSKLIMLGLCDSVDLIRRLDATRLINRHRHGTEIVMTLSDRKNLSGSRLLTLSSKFMRYRQICTWPLFRDELVSLGKHEFGPTSNPTSSSRPFAREKEAINPSSEAVRSLFLSSGWKCACNHIGSEREW